MSVWAWVLIALAVALVVYVAVVFNGFIRKRNRTQEAWAQIDVELKRRHRRRPWVRPGLPRPPGRTARP